MKRTDKNKCPYTKQEIIKPKCTGNKFACQTLAFLPMLGLTIALTGLLTIKSFGQIPTVQTPSFQNFQQVPQPWTPNPNNNLIPNYNPTTPINAGIDQHKKRTANPTKPTATIAGDILRD